MSDVDVSWSADAGVSKCDVSVVLHCSNTLELIRGFIVVVVRPGLMLGRI